MGGEENHVNNCSRAKSTKRGKGRASNPNQVTAGKSESGGGFVPPSFLLTIPCAASKRWTDNDIRPVHVLIGKDSSGADRTIWVCPFCELGISNRRTCEKHMGIKVMFSNVKDIACTVLKELNSERENYVRANFGKIAERLQRTRKYLTIEDFIAEDLENEEDYEDDFDDINF